MRRPEGVRPALQIPPAFEDPVRVSRGRPTVTGQMAIFPMMSWTDFGRRSICVWHYSRGDLGGEEFGDPGGVAGDLQDSECPTG